MLYFSKIRIFIILILTTVFTYFTFSNFIDSDDSFFKRNINLGLDLQGGSYLLLEIDNTSVIIETLQNKIFQIKKFLKDENIRTGKFNLDDTTISFSVDKTKVNYVRDILDSDESLINPYFDQFKSHQFDVSNIENNFTLVLSKYGLINIKNASLDQSIEIVRRRIDEIGTNEPTILKRGNDRILVELPGLNDPNRIKNLLGKTAKLSFQLVTQSVNETFGTQKMITEDGDEVMVSKRIILSGDNLLDAKPHMDTETNETAVLFTLDRVGAKKFGKVTTNGIGKRLAIVLDNQIISAPVIQDAIVTGTGRITGDFTFQSATDLALLLRSGALPAPLDIIEERSVGPDLGQDSINAGIFSLIIGFVLVIVFMIYKYRIFGVIANLTLILNLFILIGILSVFEATLTLPGIAGIILTVGMAVDANVLIFERIREETRNEKNKLIAFDSGYIKSRTTILDANITTLIAAIILFFMGSGPVKGFSVTLGVGILTTLFSVYFIARLLTSAYVIKNKDKSNLI